MIRYYYDNDCINIQLYIYYDHTKCQVGIPHPTHRDQLDGGNLRRRALASCAFVDPW